MCENVFILLPRSRVFLYKHFISNRSKTKATSQIKSSYCHISIKQNREQNKRKPLDSRHEPVKGFGVKVQRGWGNRPFMNTGMWACYKSREKEGERDKWFIYTQQIDSIFTIWKKSHSTSIINYRLRTWNCLWRTVHVFERTVVMHLNMPRWMVVRDFFLSAVLLWNKRTLILPNLPSKCL